MVEPEYMCRKSLLDGYVKVLGNVGLAEKIIFDAKSYVNKDIDLYTAQKEIKIKLISEHGEEWYEKSVEAVNYLIENEYCELERDKLPFFDKKSYEKDIQSGVMY